MELEALSIACSHSGLDGWRVFALDDLAAETPQLDLLDRHGHEMGIDYAIWRNIVLGATFFMNERNLDMIPGRIRAGDTAPVPPDLAPLMPAGDRGARRGCR